MDHLTVLRDKVGRLRVEIADIQKLNQDFQRKGENETKVQLAYPQRNERQQAIQNGLVQLANLGRGVASTQQMRKIISPCRTPPSRIKAASIPAMATGDTSIANAA